MHEDAADLCVGADFCQELSGDPNTAFSRIYLGDPQSRIISRSSNLSLLADMSPLCVGHLLMVSNVHYLSFGEVIRDHGTEVEHVLNQLFGQYTSTFCEPLILEHGSSKEVDGAACITHAHWHVLPLKLDLVHDAISEDDLPVMDLGTIGDLATLGDQGRAYFYCADRFRHRVYGSNHTLRRQYLRSVAGALLGIPDPEWDYAVVVRKDLLRITMASTSSWRIG
jgi:diadenosine tetraphosphate (Ap4A) HIT family hydrolase